VILHGIDTICPSVDPSIRVVLSGRAAKCRLFWRLPCSEVSAIGVHNNNVGNVCRGITERVLQEEVEGVWIPVRRPESSAFNACVREFAKDSGKYIVPTTPMAPADLVGSYVGRKRVNYQKALDSLSVFPVCRRDARLKTFVKCEKIDFAAKVDPAPRIIQPRDPRYNICVARYLKVIEHRIYQMIDRTFGSNTVLKGLNADEQGQIFAQAWSEFDDPVAVDLDCSRFDRHVSPAALRWEHRQYARWFTGHHRRELLSLLSWQIDNDCVAYCPDGKVSFSVKGNRASGDPNTAVGNILLMCAMMYGYLKPRPFSHWRLLDMADDAVVIIERHDLHLLDGLPDWYRTCGFLLKVGQVVDVLEEIQFCQTQPVLTNAGTYRMCRDPRVVLRKDAGSILPLRDPLTTAAWMDAVGQCGIALAGDLPIFGSFYSWFVRHGRPGTKIDRDPTMETGMRWLASGCSHSVQEPSADVRTSFWRAFKIDGTKQRALEGRYNALGFTFSPVNPPLPRPCVAFDTSSVPYQWSCTVGPQTGSYP
jgi:hypothetical protein